MDAARSMDTDLRQLPTGGEDGPARELRVLQGPIQQGEDPRSRHWSLLQGSIFHPSDLPAAPPGRFVSPEELQYLENEATAITEELETRKKMLPEENTANNYEGRDSGPARGLRVIQRPVQQGAKVQHSRILSLPQGSVLDPSDLPSTPPGRFVSPEELQYLEDEATAIMKELETRKKVLPDEITANSPAGRERGPAKGILHPSDLPPTPPGRFASPGELQYLEDEGTDIMEELEARRQVKEKLLKGPNRENEDDPTQAGRQQKMSKRARNKFRFRIVPSVQYWERKWKKNSSPSNVSEKQETEGQEDAKDEPARAKRVRNKFRFHVPSLRYLSGAMYSKGKRGGGPNCVPMMG